MKQTVELMMRLIKSELCTSMLDICPKNKLTDEKLNKLYDLSKHHDLAHIVGNAIEKNKLADDSQISRKFQKQIFLAVYRYERMKHEFVRACELFEKNGIDYLPLKGAVIRELYAEPWMRTSCDIDILIHSENLEATLAMLTTSGYEIHSRGDKYVSLYTSGEVHLDLHYGVAKEEFVSGANSVLTDIWSYASAVDKTHRYVLSDEMFYFYHIAHMAKHFEQGGCGVRPFFDMWMLNNRVDFDKSKREALLEKGNISEFEKAAQRLLDVWFNGAEPDNLAKKMYDYILGAGVYGSLKNKVLSVKAQKGGSIRYSLSRVFMPYKKMKLAYPILEKHKYLLPFAWIHRLAKKLLIKEKSKASEEMRAMASLSKKEDKEMAAMLKLLGL